ncbi:MAG: dihydroorotate dehydrogenase electron transfer subunit [Desulfobacterales bacterium]
MIQTNAQVLWNQAVAPACYRMGLECGGELPRARPGQFVMLRPTAQLSPLLRRPFSIHGLITTEKGVGGIQILYKVVGEGTRLLARLGGGSSVDVLGPLGTHFRMPQRGQRIVIAAGGIGVAPLTFLAAELINAGCNPGDITVFIGGRTRSELICRQDFEGLGIAVHLTTDDGSAGDACLVTHPLEAAVARRPPDILYACGPSAMLACIVGIAEKFGVHCQVSIESLMACGMGACLGCAVAGRQPGGRFLHACLDGPVLDAAELQF